MDRGEVVPKSTAYLLDSLLIALFGLQHSLMARPFFKARIAHLPERSLYLIATSAALAILMLLWQPLPSLVWQLPAAVSLGSAAGLALVAWAVATLDARAFLGLHPAPPGLRTSGPYRYFRHPIVIGTLLILWSVPRMSEGHLLFSAGMTIYAVVGTIFESRDLRR
jgi:protein-S-isoprenylcysteine O-methyltransferase Ste14